MASVRAKMPLILVIDDNDDINSPTVQTKFLSSKNVKINLSLCFKLSTVKAYWVVEI
jgi:hypothetical protein